MSDTIKNLLKDVSTLGSMSRRDFMRQTVAFGATAALTNTLFSTSALAAQPVKGGALKMGLAGGASTDSLDPATWLSYVSQNFGSTWGELLVIPSPVDGSPVPELAESWESTPDAAEWRFKIRKNVTFHNGKELTPQDVAMTIRRHADKSTKSAAAGLLTDIQDISTDGDYVVFTLERGNADFPLLLTDYHLIIQPDGGMDEPTAGIGTGPYKIEANNPGVRHMGVKYDGYWRDEVGHVDSVEIVVMNDNTARIAALQSGRVHIINSVEPKIVDLLKRSPGVVIENVPAKGNYGFVMHCNTAPFDNADLRMAMKLAIDREHMVKQILRGYGSTGNDFPINSSYALFPAEIEQRSYDPDKAKFYYKKSGHDGPIVLHVSDVAFSGSVDAAQMYQQHAAPAGIELVVKREPSDGYWSDVWNHRPFCATYSSGRATQDGVYSTYFHSKAVWNDTRFNNENFDKLVLSARSELDNNKRAEMYHDAALILRDDGGLILPMFNDHLDARREEVKGWVSDPNRETSNVRAAIRVWL